MPRRPILHKPDSAPRDTLNLFGSDESGTASTKAKAKEPSSASTSPSTSTNGTPATNGTAANGANATSASSSSSSSNPSSSSSSPAASPPSRTRVTPTSRPHVPKDTGSSLLQWDELAHAATAAANKASPASRPTTAAGKAAQGQSLNLFSTDAEAATTATNDDKPARVKPTGGRSHMDGILSTPAAVSSHTPASSLVERQSRRGSREGLSAALSSVTLNDTAAAATAGTESITGSRRGHAGKNNASTLVLGGGAPDPHRPGRHHHGTLTTNTSHNVLDAASLPLAQTDVKKQSAATHRKNQGSTDADKDSVFKPHRTMAASSHAKNKSSIDFSTMEGAASTTSSSSSSSSSSSAASTRTNTASTAAPMESRRAAHPSANRNSGNIISWQ